MVYRMAKLLCFINQACYRYYAAVLIGSIALVSSKTWERSPYPATLCIGRRRWWPVRGWSLSTTSKDGLLSTPLPQCHSILLCSPPEPVTSVYRLRLLIKC